MIGVPAVVVVVVGMQRRGVTVRGAAGAVGMIDLSMQGAEPAGAVEDHGEEGDQDEGVLSSHAATFGCSAGWAAVIMSTRHDYDNSLSLCQAAMTTRRTQQREAIRAAFAEADRPLSVAELVEAARRAAPTLGQATAYRAVNRMLEQGELKTIQMPGEPTRYEPATEAHHHFFKCRSCDKLYEVSGCDALVRHLVPRGFKLEDHEVALYGVCRRCRT